MTHEIWRRRDESEGDCLLRENVMCDQFAKRIEQISLIVESNEWRASEICRNEFVRLEIIVENAKLRERDLLDALMFSIIIENLTKIEDLPVDRLNDRMCSAEIPIVSGGFRHQKYIRLFQGDREQFVPWKTQNSLEWGQEDAQVRSVAYAEIF